MSLCDPSSCRRCSSSCSGTFPRDPRWKIPKQFIRMNDLWSSLVEGDDGCISPSGKLLCFMTNPQNYAAYAWHHSIHVWLLGRSGCSSEMNKSSPSTKELHEWSQMAGLKLAIFPYGKVSTKLEHFKNNVSSFKRCNRAVVWVIFLEYVGSFYQMLESS